MTQANSKPTAVTIGVRASVVPHLEAGLSHFQKLDKAYSSEIFETALAEPVNIFICGPPEKEFSIVEAGQSLRMLYPEAPIYFVTDMRTDFDRKDFQKNGFTEAFFLPNDQEVLSSTLLSEAARASNGRVKAFKSVQLIDISPDAALGFDLYIHLPVNNRKIRYVSGTESLGLERANKLKKHHVQSALVSEDEIGKFYEFTAKQLKSIMNDSRISETERAERREKAVRDLLTGFFSDPGKGDNIGSGRQMMSDCQEIIKAFVVDGTDKNMSWYERIMSMSNSGPTSYSHSANTATLSALLSIALGIGNPKDLALAGLLHEIGLAEVPPDVLLKSESERTPEETIQFQKHPLHSVQLIKERKMIVPESIFEMIEQHHERFDGNGYPNRVPGPRIIKEAQILGIASALEEMTTVRDGQPRMSMPEAIADICEQGLKNPGASPFDPTLLRKIRSIFAKQPESVASEGS